jgi:PII-like signaling protein
MEVSPGKKITIVTSEDRQYRHRLLYKAIVEELHRQEVGTVTVTRGIAGFGPDRIIRTWKIEVLSSALPVTIEATDTIETIDRVLPAVAEMAREALIDVASVEIVRGRSHNEAG